MNLKDYCRCKNRSGVHTETNDWYQYDVCNDCEKVLEDGMRNLNDDSNMH